MAAGSIVVDLLMRTGSWSTDTARAAKDLSKLKKEAYDTGRAIGDSFKSIAAAAGIGLSVAGLTSLVKSSIDAADHLNDLSKKTGIAVDTLGGIGFAAKQAGGDLDSASEAVGKLNKTIAAARAGDKQAGQAFAALGLTELIESGASADDVLISLADKFAGFADGPEKAAIAVRLFGKAGADMIPLLNEGGQALQDNVEYFKRYSGVTAEVAAAADQFNDTQEKLSLLSDAFGTTLTAKLLPTMQAVADEFLNLKENTELFDIAGTAISETLKALIVIGANVVYVFHSVGNEIGGIAAQIAALATGDLDGFTAISDAMKDDAARARAELDRFEQRVLGLGAAPAQKPFSDARFAAGQRPKPRAPSLPTPGKASDALQKQLDADLKAIRDASQQQQQAYAFYEKMLDGVYAEGEQSLQDYYAALKVVRDAALADQLGAIDKEIELQRTAVGKLSGDKRIDAEGKLAEAVAKRVGVVQKASQDAIIESQNETRAIKALRDSYSDLQLKVMEMSGDAASAAAIRDAKDIAAARKVIADVGGDPKLGDKYATLVGQTTKLSQAQKDYNALLDEARNREENLLLTAQESGASELDTLRAVGAERQKSLDQLGALAQRAQDLANELKTPEAIAFAEQLALAFRKASAEVDPLLQKVRGIGQNLGQGLGDIFGSAIQQGKGLKAILADIGNLISETATKELISKPLGKAFGDMLGGTGKDSGLLGGLFGVGSAKAASPLDQSALATSNSLTSLQTQGIDPTIVALQRFQETLQATPGTTDELTTGDFTRTDHGALDESITSEASRSVDDLSAGSVNATTNLVRMADAASKGGSALGLLPSIISMIQAASGGSSSGGGGILGSLVGAAMSYFGSGYDYTSGAGAANSQTGAMIQGRRAAGGPVAAGSMYQVNERGPELLTIGEKQLLMMGKQAGRVSPGVKPNERRAVLEVGEEVLKRNDPRHRDMLRFHDGGVVGRAVSRVYHRPVPATLNAPARANDAAAMRPIQINQTFPPGTNRSTTDQAAASAGAAVRKANARIR